MNPTMDVALAEARAAAARGEVPVGAVVTDAAGRVLARAGNRTEEWRDASAHAEMLALRAAAASVGEPRLPGCTLTVTLEPCPMCAQAASFFRVKRVVFGAYDPKGGGVDHGARVYAASSCHHAPEVVGGVREERVRRVAAGVLRRTPGLTGSARSPEPPDGAAARAPLHLGGAAHRCPVMVVVALGRRAGEA